MRGQRPKIPPRVRFWSNVDIDGDTGCWMWAAGRFDDGYGGFSPGGAGVTVRAHRWAYRHFVGPIKKGLLVCHACDTPECVNPAHLWLGTAADNNRDRDNKGRHYAPGPKGEKCARSQLTADNVRYLRKTHAAGVPPGWRARMAEKFGVNSSAISKIIHRRTWKHVT